MNTNNTKQQIISVLASVKVEDVFSTRLATVLQSGNIHTMDVLLGKSEAELLKLKGFGKKMLSEVEEYCEVVGIRRPPYFNVLGWLQIRDILVKAGYSEGVANLFREVLGSTKIWAVRKRDDTL